MHNKYLELFRKQSLREAQLKMLGILEAIDTICRKHHITYWIDSGTLLGAVRHGGFIPWDDDLDVAMLKSDFARFLEVAPSELPPTLFMQTAATDPGFFHRECKIRDLNSYIADGGDDNRLTYQKGLFVDIFPYSDAPSRLRKRMGKVARGITAAEASLKMVCQPSWKAQLQFLYFHIKRPLLMAVWKIMTVLTANNEFLAVDPHMSWCRAIHRKSSIFPLGEATFEGKTFPAPRDTNQYLTTLYGNWQQIPPKHKQQIHSQLIIPKLIDL